MLFLSRICLIFLLLWGGTFLRAGESADQMNGQELAQQKDEILDTLSTLVGKQETRTSSSKEEPDVKISDLKEAIKVLQDKAQRDKLIKVLSALTRVNQEANKNHSFIENLSAKITGVIEVGATTILNAMKLTQRLPKLITDEISQIGTDAAYRQNIYSLALILLTALLCAIGAEYLTRKLLRLLNIHRPKHYTFKYMHTHVIRNISPIIMFGLVGYLTIYLSQSEWNRITYQGFIFMNMVIMLRSMWLLVRVLFRVHPTSETRGQNPNFQFALAGIQTIIIGIIFGEAGALLGMGELAVQIWLKIIGFGVTGLIIIELIKNKSHLKYLFYADEERLSGVALVIAKLIEFVFRGVHIIFSLLATVAFILWMVNLELIAVFTAKSLILTAIFSGLFVAGRDWLFKTITTVKHRFWLKPNTKNETGLSYLEGPTTNIVQLIWHLLFILVLFQTWGANPVDLATSPTIQPLLSKLISVSIILIIIRTLWGWADHVAQSHIRGRMVGRRRLVESSQFVKTVTPILNSVAHWVLGFMAVILILIEFGQDVRPMLYSLGVIGIAISLGAQSLVKDIINGILTLMEGNIAVGENVTIGANTGTIESLSLRSIVLRHATGALQTIPFSEVTNIINRSRDYSAFAVNLLIPHKMDTERAQGLLNEAFQDISQDPVFGKMILEPLVISGIDKITDTGMNITGAIKIKPDPTNSFGKVFNKYLQKRMDATNFYPPASQKILNVSE
jgi:moderate conductance mechanosensitive channel